MAEPQRSDLYAGQGSRPIPDPTELTSAALAREISGLRELFELSAAGSREYIEARFEGMDRAVALLQAARDKNPEELEKRLDSLLKLVDQRFLLQDEKFASIQTQFRERDTRSERESRDNKVAVDAAFAAQKEAASEQNKSNTLAIDKSERATAETLGKQADLFNSTTNALAAQIADMKERLTRIEGMDLGRSTTQHTQQASSSYLLAVVVGIGGLLLAAAVVVIALVR